MGQRVGDAMGDATRWISGKLEEGPQKLRAAEGEEAVGCSAELGGEAAS